MFPFHVPADSQDIINEGDLLVAGRSGNDLTHSKDKSGTQIFDVDVECDYYDIPRAKGNKGLRIALLDPQLNYPVLRSDGERYRAIGGQIVFKPTFNTTPTRGSVIAKHAEIKIPYSPFEGSLLGNDDTIELAMSHERLNNNAADNTKILTRFIFIGKNSNINNNREFIKWSPTAINQKVVAEGKMVLGRVDCTTIRAFGNWARFNNWNGASSSDGHYSEWGTSDIDNMDLFDTYIQIGYLFHTATLIDPPYPGVAPTVDAVRHMFLEARINTCGVR